MLLYRKSYYTEEKTVHVYVGLADCVDDKQIRVIGYWVETGDFDYT